MKSYIQITHQRPYLIIINKSYEFQKVSLALMGTRLVSVQFREFFRLAFG
jgi:hypothetical protein